MEWSGPGFVPGGRITSGFEKKIHGRSASRANSAMQRSRAVLVLGMDVGPILDQATDRRDLSFCVPCRSSDESVRRVMQRSAFAMILCCVRIGTGCEQH